MGLIADLVGAGVREVKDAASRDVGKMGQSSHITRQNETVADFEALALTPYRQGYLTAQQAAQRIEDIARSFSAYCQQLGYPRALQGAADVTLLANQLVRDLRSQIPAGSGPIITSGGVTLPPLTDGGSAMSVDYSTLALVGLAAFLLLRRGK